MGDGDIVVVGCVAAWEFSGESAGRLQAPLEQDQCHGGRRRPRGTSLFSKSRKSCFYRLHVAKTTRGNLDCSSEGAHRRKLTRMHTNTLTVYLT